MFGSEHISAATDWLKASPNRRIEIKYSAEYLVDFSDDNGGVTSGEGEKLMEALKMALGGLPKHAD